jgi:phosphatidylserine/phosphatidylglycerophosphate/cardiolipin synthase-like enzyme
VARVEDWFLTAEERGNPATAVDRRRGDGRAWTEGNRVEALVHGATYHPRLLAATRLLREGDLLGLTDWRGDADQRLDGAGTELGAVLAGLARRGVQVRGLLWRSHPSRAHFSEEQNLHLGEVVNQAGGEVLLDERVRGPGSQHQKLVLLRHPGREDEDIAFLGGIDLCHSRGTTRGTSATPSRCRSTSATALGRPGMTCSWRSTARRSATCGTPSASAGRTPPRSTTVTPGGPG